MSSTGATAEKLNYIANLISNNSDITYETDNVYYDNYNDNEHVKFSIGDTLVISMLDANNHSFTLIGFNHDTLADSTAYGGPTITNCAGFTFQEFACWNNEQYQMHSSQYAPGTWEDSLIRTSAMETVYTTFGPDFQDIIKPIYKLTNSGDVDSLGELITTTDKCFILSTTEMGENRSVIDIKTIDATEGQTYRYYINLGSSWQNSEFLLENLLWTRSPNIAARRAGGGSSSNVTYIYFLCFYKSGHQGITPGIYATNLSNISIAFCI